MAAKARLHWFWRGMITVLVGFGVGSIARPAFNAVQSVFAQRLDPELAEIVAGLIVLGLPVLASTAGVYVLLTCRCAAYGEGECYCRKCGYILRGLSEPRCPECGEAI
jgi:hypothetical protein